VRILLDTHVFLWAITEDSRLSRNYREIYEAESSDLILSTASIWEILIKRGIGKLDLPEPALSYVSKQLEHNRIRRLSIQMHHLAELERLPPVHKDPFDRMIAAQARSEKIPVMSADPAFRGYGLEIL
jgi:PIN domain nuclease of toxin-antitoxin system